MQKAAVIAALPLAVVMLLTCYGIWKALSDEVFLRASGQLPSAPPIQAEGAAFWRRRLGAIVSHPSKRQVLSYIGTTVSSALKTVVAELGKRNLEAEVERVGDGLQLTVRHGDGAPDFVYAVRAVGYPVPAFALTDAARREGERNLYFRAEVFLIQGGRGYDIYGYETTQVIADVINHYDQFRHYLHAKGTG
ncbi:hypothetical protein [Microvirga sp. 2TAF3]|uniref:hypothetical protein n=1 Tax=Microvirga sp. 2TAF3 TaxID=3233014 RepID=UPI003F96A35A